MVSLIHIVFDSAYGQIRQIAKTSNTCGDGTIIALPHQRH